MATIIILVRHGESKANADPSIRLQKEYDDDDVGLSFRGRAQAVECREKKSHQFKTNNTLWWCSPMNRAIQTIKIIAPDQPFVVDPRLREMKWPKFNTEAEKISHNDRKKACGMFAHNGKDFESGEEVVVRLRSFLRDNMAAMTWHNNIIVCHEIVMRAFKYLETRNFSVFDTMDFDNCETFHWTGFISELL